MTTQPGSKLLEIAAALPIAEVTLMEDRAQVVRRGKVDLPQGRVRLTVPDVAPVLSDRSIAVKLAPAQARVDDVRVRRRSLVLDRDRPAALARIEAEIEVVKQEITRVNARSRRADGRRYLADRMLELTLGEVAQDAAAGRSPAAELTARLEAVERTRVQARDELVETAEEFRKLEVKANDLAAQKANVESPASRRSAHVEVDLTVAGPGIVEVTVSYVVPGACWRPQHRARLLEDAVAFETDGCVWQHTGEDWSDVQIAFSTQRTTLGCDPPVLTDDLLRVRPKPKEEAVEIREQAVETAGFGAGETAARSPELPGIDDGGSVVNLRAAHVVSIPSDGRPHRVPIGRFESPVKTELVAVPVLATAVFLRSEQVNNGAVPLLAGPVDLIRDSGRVGRTTVLYIAPGERFELGWGPDPEVRVSRRDDLHVEGPGLLGSWTTNDHSVEVKFSNLSSTEKRVILKERLPVSEIEKIRVEYDAKGSSPAMKAPDENGFAMGLVKLPPRGREQVKVRYKLQRHKDVTGLPELA